MMNPKIRFKKSDGSDYQDYESIKLQECLTSVSVKKKETNAPIYSVSNTAGFIPQIEQFDGRDNIASDDTSNYKLVSQGQFAYNPSRINVGSLARLDKVDKVAVSPLYVVFDIVNHLHSDYLLDWFDTQAFKKGMNKNIEGGVRDSLSYDGLTNIDIIRPVDIEEQAKIANFLSEIDNLIASAENEIESTKQLKKAMLQKMFLKKGEKVPEIRFPEFTDDWEQRELCEICDEFQSGKSIKASEITDSGDYAVYGGNGIRGYTSTYNHDGDYALIGRQGALCGNMNFSSGKAYFTEHAVAVHGNTDNSTLFLYYLLDLMNLGQYSGQSAQPGLAVNKIIHLKAKVPKIEEQQQIGSYFRNLDHLITLHQRKLDAYKKFKKAMIQKMFV